MFHHMIIVYIILTILSVRWGCFRYVWWPYILCFIHYLDQSLKYSDLSERHWRLSVEAFIDIKSGKRLLHFIQYARLNPILVSFGPCCCLYVRQGFEQTAQRVNVDRLPDKFSVVTKSRLCLYLSFSLFKCQQYCLIILYSNCSGEVQ